jgi:hypothetical protein
MRIKLNAEAQENYEVGGFYKQFQQGNQLKAEMWTNGDVIKTDLNLPSATPRPRSTQHELSPDEICPKSF